MGGHLKRTIAGAFITVVGLVHTLCAAGKVAIVVPPDASPMLRFAAQEVRRYAYLRSGSLPQIASALPPKDASADGVIIISKPSSAHDQSPLASQGYRIRSGRMADGRTIVTLIGNSDAGTLYAAYRFAELLGIRFSLDGDVIPDATVALKLPENLDETRRPLFALRGIQPFHDFPEGPDWWDADHYRAVIGQLPKLGMNFIGLHTYPENMPHAEPTVWIGPTSEQDNGTVRASYPSWYFNTAHDDWGYKATPTGSYAFGASGLFDRDAVGTPVPTTQQSNDAFNQTAAVLRQAFTFAHELGVKTCVGTETPLTVPAALRERLKAAGKDASDPAVVQEIYEGIFRRAAAAYPLDYYWIWTPERTIKVEETQGDLKAAHAALEKSGAKFALAVCGWGWLADHFGVFDPTLPKSTAFSCINDQVGNAPVSPAFERVSGREKWAIPWMEDDPGLSMPQLWVGRTRADASDALRYGCTGLMGIHWRTRAVGPNFSALAQAAWAQKPWDDEPSAAPQEKSRFKVTGGTATNFPANKITPVDDAPLYQSVRWGLRSYALAVPNGAYHVRLQFCEPHYAEAGRRVFGVKLQRKQVIEHLDIFAKVGKDHALDYNFDDVAVTDGALRIEFTSEVEYPSIAAISVESKETSLKINCGGGAYEDYLADEATPMRSRPTRDFYLDWANVNFGAEASGAIADVFVAVDGKLPRPASWHKGPGLLLPDARPWSESSKAYAFVATLESIEPRITGEGNRARFDYWLETFRYLRAMAKSACTLSKHEQAMAAMTAATDPGQKRELAGRVLPIRKQLIADLAEMHAFLMGTVSSPGELGTVTNIQSRTIETYVRAPAVELTKALGTPLPQDVMPSPVYTGPDRIIVPTVRTAIAAGESLHLRVIILAKEGHEVRDPGVYVRPLGAVEFVRVDLRHLARGVYEADLPAAKDDFEYYVQAATTSPLRFPPTAPRLNQTVVVMPTGSP